jgi:hypothetical protein
MNYAVTFTGYVDRRVAPEKFPDKVEDVVLIQVDGEEGLVKFVNDRLAMYLKNSGLGVAVDKDTLKALGIENADRLWMPYRYLAYMTATHRVVTGEIPGYTDDGITAYASGKPVVKN